MPEWITGRRWIGGAVARLSDGREVYYIRRTLGGRRWSFAIEAGNEAEANVQWDVFRRDPTSYVPPSRRRGPGLHLSAELVAEVVRHKTAAEQISAKWAWELEHYGAFWVLRLAGRDISAVREQEIAEILHHHPAARRNKIKVLKSIVRYLKYDRPEGARLAVDRDPIAAVRVPRAASGAPKPRTDYSLAHVEATYRHMSPWRGRGANQHSSDGARPVDVQAVRDVVRVLLMTGMHFTELERIARHEHDGITPVNHSAIAAVVAFRQWKSKDPEPHRVSIDGATLAAVERLLARRAAPSATFCALVLERAAASASEALGRPVAPIQLGSLRHTFVSRATECGEEIRFGGRGVTLAAVTEVTKHSIATARRHYNRVRVPVMVRLPVVLAHPDDPPVPAPTPRG